MQYFDTNQANQHYLSQLIVFYPDEILPYNFSNDFLI